jgi:hypothetical protein
MRLRKVLNIGLGGAGMSSQYGGDGGNGGRVGVKMKTQTNYEFKDVEGEN